MSDRLTPVPEFPRDEQAPTHETPDQRIDNLNSIINTQHAEIVRLRDELHHTQAALTAASQERDDLRELQQRRAAQEPPWQKGLPNTFSLLPRYKAGGYGAMVEDPNGKWVEAKAVEDMLEDARPEYQPAPAQGQAALVRELLSLVQEASEIMTITYAGNFPAGIESFLVRSARALASQPQALVREDVEAIREGYIAGYRRGVAGATEPLVVMQHFAAEAEKRAEQAEAALAEKQRLIQQVEWDGGNEDFLGGWCPWCRGSREMMYGSSGHEPDCPAFGQQTTQPQTGEQK